MATPAILKRIDNVETKLTPKEWAIRLADEMRKYPSEIEFYYSFLNYSSIKETPFGKPFFILNKQAEEQHPGHKPENIRIQHRIARKLRGEYQTLKILMSQSNEKIKHNIEIWKLKASLQLSNMNALIMQDLLAMEGIKIGDNDNTEQTCALGFPSMIKDWRPKIMDLIIDFLLYDSLVNIIQGKYFDGHSIIYRDVEVELAEIKTMIEDAVVAFNEYLIKMGDKIKTDADKNGTGDTAEPFKRFLLDIEGTRKRFDQESIVAIAEKWAKDAKDKVIFEILDEMDKYEEARAFAWNIARENIKDHQTAQNELDSIHIVSD